MRTRLSGIALAALVLTFVVLSPLAQASVLPPDVLCHLGCGFLDSDGSFSTFRFPGALYTMPSGINNNGQVVGWYQKGPAVLGFVYDGAGNFDTIGPPGRWRPTVATGINDQGQVVGWARPVNGGDIGWLDTRGTFSFINYPGATDTHLLSINTNGDIVGSYRIGLSGGSFLYSGGVFLPINYPGALGTVATGINNYGQIVGWYVSSGLRYYGFVETGGVFQSINSPFDETFLHGINDQGDVVGNSSFGYRDPFVYDGKTFTLITFPGHVCCLAVGINDSGEIVGQYFDLAPEPSSFLLLISGAAGLFGLVRKWRWNR